MSDIHGSPVEFEEALELVDLSGDNLLILCGDYIHGYDSYTVLQGGCLTRRRLNFCCTIDCLTEKIYNKKIL